MARYIKLRWFKVQLKNDMIAILSEKEITKYLDYIQDIKTELTNDEIKLISPRILTNSIKQQLDLI